MQLDSKIYIAGHDGLIGSALLKKLKSKGFTNIVTKTKDNLDLINQFAVNKFFEEEKPEYVFLCAGKVGSLYAASTYRAEFIYENTMIEYNVIHASFEVEVKKLIFFTSPDIYSKKLEDPYKEEDLTDGQIDFNAESFVLAKASTIKMCESYNSQYGTDFITIISANLYGERQAYSQLNSTVIPALIKRIHEAKVTNLDKVRIWGSGEAIRNFIYVDDLVESSLFLMNSECEDYIYNITYPEDISIKNLAYIIKDVVGYSGNLEFDISKPEGIKSKRISNQRIQETGYKAKTNIQDGIKITYQYFLHELDKKEIKLKEIKKIKVCDKDKTFYNKIIKNTTNSFSQPKDYKNIVVLKPWGYEFLIYENQHVAVWFLFIKNNYSTSMHCHPKKKTSLVLLHGNAFSNTFSNRTYLDSSEALIIDKGVFHATKALSEDGIFLIEIETPPDKTDLIRLEDRYGRQSNGYEGTSEMITENIKDEFNFFDFFNKNVGYSHKVKNKILTLEKFTQENLHTFRTYDDELIVSFRGELEDIYHTKILNVGDTQYGYKFCNKENMKIVESDELHIFRIKVLNEEK